MALTVEEVQAVLSFKDELSGKLNALTGKIDTSFGGILSLATKLGSAFGLAFSTKALFDFAASSVKAFSEQENAIKKLDTAIVSQMGNIPGLSLAYQDMASEFQSTTVFADELINEMQALLIQIGNVGPHEMKKALTAATDLAAGLGIDLRTATMLVGKAFAGETGTLTRYGIVIDEAKLKTEGITVVLDALNQKFGGQAQAQLETYSGKIQNLGNRWGEFKEQLGGVAASSTVMGKALDVASSLLASTGNVVPIFTQKIDLSTEAQKKLGAELNKLKGVTLSIDQAMKGFPHEKTAEELKKIADAAKKAKEELEQSTGKVKALEAGFFGLDGSVTPLIVDIGALEKKTRALREAVANVEQTAHIVNFGYKGMADNLGNLLEKTEMTEPAIVKWNREIGFVGPTLDMVKVKTKTFGATLRSSFGELPNIIQSAFTGGGGISGALKAFGTKMGSDLFSSGGALASVTKHATSGLTKLFGDNIGAALGAAIPGIGALIGPGLQLLWGGIKKLFGGPSKEELQGRDLVSAFETQIQGMLTAQQRAEAGGESWKMTLIAVRDAYLATGRTALDAERDTKALWDSSRSGADATRAAIALIEPALAAAGKAGVDATNAQKAASEAQMLAFTRQLEELTGQRRSLFDAVSREAPEAVMGVIEAGMRGEIEVLDRQIAEQHHQMEEAGRSLSRVLSDIRVDPVRIPVIWDIPEFPGGGFPGGSFEGFQHGGPVQKTGLALVHQGEYVVPEGGARIGGRSDPGEHGEGFNHILAALQSIERSMRVWPSQAMSMAVLAHR